MVKRANIRYTDEELIGYIEDEVEQWVTIMWGHPRGKPEGIATRSQLQRLTKAGRLRDRTLSASYWLGSWERGEPAIIVQARLP